MTFYYGYLVGAVQLYQANCVLDWVCIMQDALLSARLLLRCACHAAGDVPFCMEMSSF